MTTTSVDEDQSDQSKNIGTHVCALYKDSKEYSDLIVPFFIKGLSNDERCICISGDYTKDIIVDMFVSHNFNVTDYIENGRFTVMTPNDLYTKSGNFNKEQVLKDLIDVCAQTVQSGFKKLRITGEANWISGMESDLQEFMDYESATNRVIQSRPITALCLYDKTKFSGNTLFTVLQVHPELIEDAIQMKNPYYISPDVSADVVNKSVSQNTLQLILGKIKQDEVEKRKYSSQMQDKISDLEYLNKSMVGRELKMVELKNKIVQLEQDLESIKTSKSI